MTVKDAEDQFISVLYTQGYLRGTRRMMAMHLIDIITGANFRDRLGDTSTILTLEQKAKFDKYYTELRAGRPYEYVLNQATFHGLSFYVDENVVIPHSDTSRMVKWALQSFEFEGRDPRYKEQELKIIDIGTGCGNIAITLKKHLPLAKVYAYDNSEAALQIAKRNAVNNNVDIEFIHMDLFHPDAWEKVPKKADLMICNPPYVPPNDQETLDRIKKMYEPYEGLFFDDEDQLKFYSGLILLASFRLKRNAFLFTENYEGLASEVMKIFERFHFDPYLYQGDIWKDDIAIGAYKTWR